MKKKKKKVSSFFGRIAKHRFHGKIPSQRIELENRPVCPPRHKKNSRLLFDFCRDQLYFALNNARKKFNIDLSEKNIYNTMNRLQNIS